MQFVGAYIMSKILKSIPFDTRFDFILICDINTPLYKFFKSFPAPTAETLFLMVLSILAMESAHSIRFQAANDIEGLEKWLDEHKNAF